MLVAGFPAGAWGTNCYVVAAGPGEECLVVDPGQDSMDTVSEIIRENRLKPVSVLLTHGHIDHVWCAAPLVGAYDMPAYIHPGDRYRLVDPAGTSIAAAREQLLAMTKGALELTEPSDVRALPQDAPITVAGIDLDVLHAPGHTEGSVVFIRGESGDEPPVMFSGDLLFAGSIGRTDLPGGDHAAMLDSLRRVVLTQPDEMVVLPGHGDQTTIGGERAANPFLRELLDGDSPTEVTRGL